MNQMNMTVRNVEALDPKEGIKVLSRQFQALVEQLEYTLRNLTSSNIREINTTVTQILDGQGNSVISGDRIDLKGPHGERFRVGYDAAVGSYRFELIDRDGAQVFFVNSAGQLVVAAKAGVTVDGGEW